MGNVNANVDKSQEGLPNKACDVAALFRSRIPQTGKGGILAGKSRTEVRGYSGWIHLSLLFLGLFFLLPCPPARAASLVEQPFGFLYSKVRLTLEEGYRQEWLGPLVYHHSGELADTWAIPPLYSQSIGVTLDGAERDFLYPLLTWDRYGEEYRFQIFQIFNFAGGRSMQNTNVHRVTFFPFYFQQRSDIPDRNYTALFPIYGTLKNRFFRDESYWVLWPLYIRSKKRDVVTHNVLYPFLHWRHGEELRGGQFWPLYGFEEREPFSFTNHWGDLQLQAGHRKRFVLWPFFTTSQAGLGTTNPVRELGILPLYYHQRSPNRDMTMFPWPLGYAHTVDRENHYTEWAAPWPFVMFARGEGKTLNRVFPLFNLVKRPTESRTHILWPLYMHQHIHDPPLDRKRTRVLFFLYGVTKETNLDAGTTSERRSVLPLFMWYRTHQGKERLQILAFLDPIIPLNKAINRNYSHLWSLWRAEKDAETGRATQSLLWNLYRRESSPESKKFSLLFGLFQYEHGTNGRRGRLFYVPIHVSKHR